MPLKGQHRIPGLSAHLSSCLLQCAPRPFLHPAASFASASFLLPAPPSRSPYDPLATSATDLVEDDACGEIQFTNNNLLYPIPLNPVDVSHTISPLNDTVIVCPKSCNWFSEVLLESSARVGASHQTETSESDYTNSRDIKLRLSTLFKNGE